MVMMSLTLSASVWLPRVVYAQPTDDPCAIEGYNQGVVTYCVKDENACAESPIGGASSLCPGTQVCCVPSIMPSVQATPDPEEAEAEAEGVPSQSSQVIPPGYGLKNPLGPRTIPQVIGGLVQWLGGLAGSMFFLYLLWGGAQWMTARGSDEQAQTGRKKIIAATAGIIVVLTAYLLVSAVIGLVPK